MSALFIALSFLIRHYYLTDKNSLKQHLIFICISFIKITIFIVAVKELTGVSLNYSVLVLFFVALTIFTLWEKGVLLLVFITVLGIRVYNSAESSTAYQLYNSSLSKVTRYEEMHGLLLDGYREDFTPEEFQELKPYLDSSQGQRFLRFYQPAFLEFEDGRIIMLEVSRADADKQLRFSNIELLPEEIGSYFRYYPLEIERKADYPKDKEEEDRETIIETRGKFVSHASLYQERGWYEELIGVFGDEKVWNELWKELDGFLAPEGPVQGAGTSRGGYLVFTFYRDWKVDKEVLDEIYLRFRDKAAKHGISHLPVVFEWAEAAGR